MSDDLIITGGGSVVVASDALLARADLLARLSADLAALHSELEEIAIESSMLRRADAPLSAAAAARSIEIAMGQLATAQAQCDWMSAALAVALRGYGTAEHIAAQATHSVSEQLGWVVGHFSPLLVVGAAVAMAPAAGTALMALLATGQLQGGAAAGGARGTALMMSLQNNNALITNPTTVALLRAAVDSSDDAMGGALRFPAEFVATLGDDGAGLTGLSTAAAVAVLLGRAVGAFGENGVVVRATGPPRVTTAVHGVSGRAARIPEPQPASKPQFEPTGAQIRIDRYSRAGEPDRFEVYIAGTVDFGLASADQPWDMTSNVAGVAGLPAGSYQAVRDAMAQAGVTPTSPVVLTGYSQGGLVASLVAASGDYNVREVVTFGAPAGQVQIPADVPVLTVRHSDDIVPATGGSDSNPRALVIEREVFRDRSVPTEELVPAHQLHNYRDTASLIDLAESDRVRAALAELDAAAARDRPPDTVESTKYRAFRRPEGVATFSGGR